MRCVETINLCQYSCTRQANVNSTQTGTLQWHRPATPQAVHRGRIVAGGFTLIEVLVVCMLIGILMMGTTNFIPLVDEARSQQVADSLRAQIAQARSESVARGGNVRLCGSANGNTCTNSLSGGWVVYYDDDNDALLTAADSILSRYEQDSDWLTIDTTTGAGTNISQFGFDYRGFPTEALTIGINSGDSGNTLRLFANGRIDLQ